MKMHRVTLLPENRVIEAEGDPLLSDLLADAGVHLPVPCGGKGKCRKCLAEASGGLSVPAPAETAAGLPHGTRLACQTRITGDCSVMVGPLMKDSGAPAVPAERKGDFALAVDIGTTTIKASLVHLESGEAYQFPPALNPQRRYGHDVISRIAASSDEEIHRRQVDLLRGEIRRIMDASRMPAGSSVVRLALSGNTVMTYYALGRDVRPLGTFPYIAAERDFAGLTTEILGFSGDPVPLDANPAASAFLGGDLVGGLALTDALNLREGVFFIDLGTNGEMFLRPPDGSVYAASCAMGPALEGMNISYGMTATDGAIVHCRHDGRSLHIDVMGGTEPAGLSGTGIIDILAILLKMGAVDATGLMARDRMESSISGIVGLRWIPEERAVGVAGPISLTQMDIRNVQLAKGASLAASRVLLRESGLSPDDIKTVVIAGSFGEHLDINNFRSLSFIPEFPAAEYRFLGNTSLGSAERACRDAEFLRLMKGLRDRITVIDLNESPGFNDLFMDSLSF